MSVPPVLLHVGEQRPDGFRPGGVKQNRRAAVRPDVLLRRRGEGDGVSDVRPRQLGDGPQDVRLVRECRVGVWAAGRCNVRGLEVRFCRNRPRDGAAGDVPVCPILRLVVCVCLPMGGKTTPWSAQTRHGAGVAVTDPSDDHAPATIRRAARDEACAPLWNTKVNTMGSKVSTPGALATANASNAWSDQASFQGDVGNSRAVKKSLGRTCIHRWKQRRIVPRRPATTPIFSPGTSI